MRCGAWHLLQVLWTNGTCAGSLPLPVFVALSFFAGMAQLTAYRVLMVWVYDRTEPVLVATLMHGSLTASTIFVFTPVATGASFLISRGHWPGMMWIVGGGIRTPAADRHRRPLQRRMA